MFIEMGSLEENDIMFRIVLLCFLFRNVGSEYYTYMEEKSQQSSAT